MKGSVAGRAGRWFAVWAGVTALLSGCGGSTGNSSAPPAPVAQTGYFIDDPVSGLTYACSGAGAAANNGLTGADGSFSYFAGQSCIFRVGKVTLGQPAVVAGDGKVTPQDVAGVVRSATGDPSALTIAQFLQSLNDGSVAGKITIPASIRTQLDAIADVSLVTPSGPKTPDELDTLIGSITGATRVAASVAKVQLDAQLVSNVRSDAGSVSSGAARVLRSISVRSSKPRNIQGATETFTATGYYSDGTTQDLSASATWASSDTAFVTVAAGVGTGVAPGYSTITATYTPQGAASAVVGKAVQVTVSNDAITTRSIATATTLGMQKIAAAPGSSSFDASLSVGDSWRITINSLVSPPSFKIEQIASDFAPPQTISGNLATIDGASFTIPPNQSGLTITGDFKIDPRTNVLNGVVNWRPSDAAGQMVSQFTATGYSIPPSQFSQRVLDGRYAFGGRLTRYGRSIELSGKAVLDASSKISTRTLVGTMKIEGTQVFVCEDDAVNDAGTACVGGSTPVQYTAVIDEAAGLVRLTTVILNETVLAGIVHVQAGDLGPVLTVDISKPDPTGNGGAFCSSCATTPRTWAGAREVGQVLAGRLNVLSAAETDGIWTDLASGATATLSGSRVTLSSNIVVQVQGSPVDLGSTFSFDHNKLFRNGALTTVNGAFASVVSGNLLFQGFPLSSSLGALVFGDGTLHLYRR